MWFIYLFLIFDFEAGIRCDHLGQFVAGLQDAKLAD